MSPKRIQRRRTPGWRIGDRLMTYAGPRDGVQYARELVITPEIAVAFARVAFEPDRDDARAELGGHDLTCWCPLEDKEGNPVPCHTDVLLELANPKEPR